MMTVTSYISTISHFPVHVGYNVIRLTSCVYTCSALRQPLKERLCQQNNSFTMILSKHVC